MVFWNSVIHLPAWQGLLSCLVIVIGLTGTAMMWHLKRKFSFKTFISGITLDRDYKHCVAVIIAARNEERDIGATLTKLCDYKEVSTIFVIDDGSTDRTADIVRNIVELNPQVRLLKAPALPDGWIGKTHAIHWASQFADSEYILFTDADVCFMRPFLSELLHKVDQEAIDHVGGFFSMKLCSTTEAILGPLLAMVAYISLCVSQKKGSGIGAFNLVCTSAYRQIGGHALISSNIVDDVALARLLKHKGFKSVFVDLSEFIHVRLFQGLGGFMSAVARSSVAFLGIPPWLAMVLSACGVILSFAIVTTFIMLFFTDRLFLSSPNQAVLHRLLVVFCYCCIALPFVYAGWLHTRSRYWGILFPLGLFIMCLSVFCAAAKKMVGCSITWRGRDYPS